MKRPCSSRIRPASPHLGAETSVIWVFWVKNEVFERFYLWSLSANDGEACEPICSRLRRYAGSFMPLSHLFFLILSRFPKFIGHLGLHVTTYSTYYLLGAAGSHFLTGLPELWHLGLQSLGSACPRSLDSVVDQTRRHWEGQSST